MEREVHVRLTGDQALILFDWLQRMEDEDHAAVPIAHQGEIAALWGLSGALEKTLVEPFGPDYGELVDAARTRLRRAAFGDAEDVRGS